ncbi:hypothetical protein NPX13_g4255 [Xylaria arbuscula]|uniref:Cytochrome P450 n=1 Tax=Xylaria arbuscula TaxID=114810 RepID=A0A9W8TNI2_9PEZI|nr:hypothetical protein NPX13_g4255 [Xylaria arbuscula]
MTPQMSHLAIDIVGKLALGYDLSTQAREENRFFARAMSVSFFLSNNALHIPAFHRLHKNWVFDSIFWEAREKFTHFIEKMVSFRLALDVHAKPDLFSFVADSLPSEAAKTRDSVIWKEALVFLTAGGDTVATAMTSVFSYLSCNPRIYARLAEEVRSTFVDGRDITVGSKLASCRYLGACTDKSLRMPP